MRRLGVVDAGISFVVFVVLTVVLLVSWRDCSKRRRCEDLGGTVVEYDCVDHMRCTTYDSSGTTMCSPTRDCKWRCEGLPPERR